MLQQAQTTSMKMCYQNTYGVVEGEQDFELLWLYIDDGKVKGEYNWLPAFKDKRIGSFWGKTSGESSADVEYLFSQEGINTRVRLILTYDERSVSIKGGEALMGLTARLYRIDCSQTSKQ